MHQQLGEPFAARHVLASTDEATPCLLSCVEVGGRFWAWNR